MKKIRLPSDWHNVIFSSELKILILLIIFTSFGFFLGIRYHNYTNKLHTDLIDTPPKQVSTGANENNDIWEKKSLPQDSQSSEWFQYTAGRLSFKYPPKFQICKFGNVIQLISTERKNICNDSGNINYSKNLVGTTLYKPNIVYISNHLPVPVFSGMARGSSIRFIFANFEHENERVLIEMHEDNSITFLDFYQILSTAKFR